MRFNQNAINLNIVRQFSREKIVLEKVEAFVEDNYEKCFVKRQKRIQKRSSSLDPRSFIAVLI